MKERLRALFNGRGLWALADQGIVSGGNFLTNILVARTLTPAEYGVYILIFGIILFLNNLHAALITYPLSVKGASADRAGLRYFASGSLLLTVVLVLPLSIGVFGAVWAVGRLHLAPWVCGVLLLWLIQETIRRALMAHLRYREILWGDALTYLGQAGLVWTLSQRGQPSVEAIFGVMALTSGAAGALQAIQLGLKSVIFSEMWRFAEIYWDLGRWVLLTNLMSIVTSQAVPWTLAFFHGTQEAAALQAVSNVLGVVHPVLFSLNSQILPAAARAYLEGGVGAARRVTLGYATQGAALIMPYYAALMVWPEGALYVFYGPGSPYLGLDVALRLFVLIYIFIYLSYVLGALLSGLEENQSVFLVQLASSFAILALGLPLAVWGGVVWASIGVGFSVLARVVASIFFLRRIK